jgi:hypothetical protein
MLGSAPLDLGHKWPPLRHLNSVDTVPQLFPNLVLEMMTALNAESLRLFSELGGARTQGAEPQGAVAARTAVPEAASGELGSPESYQRDPADEQASIRQRKLDNELLQLGRVFVLVAAQLGVTVAAAVLAHWGRRFLAVALVFGLQRLRVW